MDIFSISINKDNTEQKVSELVKLIQTEIMDAGRKSGEQIISVIENSSGDFAGALIEAVEQEVKIIQETGELLMAMADYTQSAAAAFTEVDNAYRLPKLP